MSLHEFWTGVDIARRELAAADDRSHGGADGLGRALRSLHLWLVPAAVDGFDADDFDFLPPDRRTELAGLVGQFREIANEAEDGASLRPDALEGGKSRLKRIVEILEFDRYPDSDALRYGMRIERAFRDRPEIVGMKFRTGLDYAGTRTLWIDVTLADDVSQDERRFLEVARPLDRELDRVARRVAPELWPYISIRAAARRPAAPAMSQ